MKIGVTQARLKETRWVPSLVSREPLCNAAFSNLHQGIRSNDVTSSKTFLGDHSGGEGHT